MPTPTSGAISMNDMNVQITRASGTATVDMNTIRTRYGGSGAISFSDLYKSEGFIVTCSTYTSKFVNFDGWWNTFAVGSVSPNESNNSVQVAANSYIYGVRAPREAVTAASVEIGQLPGAAGNTLAITDGFRGTNVTRVVLANTSRSITASQNNAVSVTYDVPASGTIHCLIKF